MNRKLAAIAVGLALSAPVFAENSNTAITQNGDANFAAVEQSYAFYSSASVDQNGYGNKVGTQNEGQQLFYGIRQLSVSNAVASISQYGEINQAGILQSLGGDHQTAQITQGGSDCSSGTCQMIYSHNNFAGVTQMNNASNSTANIWQYGDNNNAGITQNYGASEAAITQSGYHNSASTWQFLTGSYGPNVATITQYGNANYAYASQTGSANSVNIKQH